ncbi:MAG TPA: hypothetical protein VHK88_16860 [Aquihabitans sp.]|jgi:hypothetical protein|nr:hypothetical protein [Aquihabitans sp.]
MTDASDPTSDDQDRLDALEGDVDALRERAEDDLEPGGQGRTFADEGVREQVEHKGDTEHPGGAINP